jgi:hypothetical protein
MMTRTRATGQMTRSSDLSVTVWLQQLQIGPPPEALTKPLLREFLALTRVPGDTSIGTAFGLTFLLAY